MTVRMVMVSIITIIKSVLFHKYISFGRFVLCKAVGLAVCGYGGLRLWAGGGSSPPLTLVVA